MSLPGKSKLLVTTLVGVGLVPCALNLLALRLLLMPRHYNSMCYTTTLAPYTDEKSTPYTQDVSLGDRQEISLQETLDRLGYTVNVPTQYGGHTLLRWNDYRVSTQDDSLDATRFHSKKTSTFQKVSEQGMLEGSIEFGMVDAQGSKRPILKADHNSNTYWVSAQDGDARDASVPDNSGFYINNGYQTIGGNAILSGSQQNEDTAPHLLALPARVGGHWVSEGGNAGHWEGGQDTGGVLLCWEDWQDWDYQDMVIVADGVVPEAGGETPLTK